MISIARKGLVNIFELAKQAIKLPSFNILFSQSAVMVVLVLADVVFARVFSVEMFGTWKQLGLLINLVIPLMSLGIPEGFKYYAALKPEESKSHLFRVLKLVAGVFIFVSIFFPLGGINLLAKILNNDSLVNFRYMIPLLYIVMSCNQIFRNLMINNKQTEILLRSAVAVLIVGSLLILLNVMIFKYITGTLLWISLSLMFIALFSIPTFTYLFKHGKEIALAKKQHVEGRYLDYLKIGFPLYVAAFISIIGSNLDKALVSSLTNVSQFAIYSVGAFEIPFFSMISASVSQSIYPELVKLYKQQTINEARELWLKTTLRVTYITYPILLLLMIFAKPLIVLIFTDKYLAGVHIFKTFLLLGFWRNGYYGGLISASGKTKWITLYSAISLAMNVSLSFLLYRIIGLYGIAYGAVLATAVTATLQLWHEKLLGGWVREIILDKVVLVLIICILFFYFI
ncbi:Membrane protein involved in the export of O-antigen and teichoic acid [Chitinophaga sp. CF118]|uniref:lipopolysaccharide biosynthesis protein n=1 Tax=Chitinophaga sp. CF118 TaxID=1884367 RepID=UPI0008DFC916|nr:oligosaccharide flippase family protein [Chitinophaga sp. CF118]SFD80588.1 Membrane protein involved in the export of O-antigen and teichoic acid [Chitinophaga sp. CF118]